jgi:hypothetical protein
MTDRKPEIKNCDCEETAVIDDGDSGVAKRIVPREVNRLWLSVCQKPMIAETTMNGHVPSAVVVSLLERKDRGIVNIPIEEALQRNEITKNPGSPSSSRNSESRHSDQRDNSINMTLSRKSRLSVKKNKMKQKILNQTLIIIIAFFICWTPYVFIALWYQIDVGTASRLPSRFIEFLYMFAVTNSVVNPFIYGKFLFR